MFLYNLQGIVHFHLPLYCHPRKTDNSEYDIANAFSIIFAVAEKLNDNNPLSIIKHYQLLPYKISTLLVKI